VRDEKILGNIVNFHFIDSFGEALAVAKERIIQLNIPGCAA